MIKRGIPVPPSRAAGWSRLVGALALPVLVLAALGARTGFVPVGAVVPTLVVGFGLGVLALILGLYALTDIWHSGAEGAGAAAAGIIYAFPAILLLAIVAAAAFTYPPVSDLSTDPSDPPALASGLAGPNGQRPSETETTPQSRGPALAPRVYDLPLVQVYETAKALVEDRGWTVREEAPPPSLVPKLAPSRPVAPGDAAGSEDDADAAVLRALSGKAIMTQSRSEVVAPEPPPNEPGESPAPDEPEAADPEIAAIEAVAPTLVFGFPDRVALRFRTGPGGTRVDMRSASAVGEHDLGQNARRIQSFLAALDAALVLDPTGTSAPPPLASPPPPVGQPDATAGR